MEVNPRLVEQINNAKKVILSVEDEIYAYRRARSNLYDVKNSKRSPLGWLCVVFCCYIISMIPASFVSFIIGSLSQSLAHIFSVPIFILVFAFCWFYWVIFRKKEKIEKYTNEMNSNRDILDDQFEKYADFLRVIPEDYRSPEAIKIMSRLAESGRALTMQEALNLTEEEFHRRRVEKANREQLDKLDDINERIDDLYYDTWHN